MEGHFAKNGMAFIFAIDQSYLHLFKDQVQKAMDYPFYTYQFLLPWLSRIYLFPA